MWLAVIVCLGLAAVAIVWLGVIPPPNAVVVLKIREGSACVKRGRLQLHVQDHVNEILSEEGIARGFIALTPNNRVVFSRQIPGSVRQRLRNVLFNRWVD